MEDRHSFLGRQYLPRERQKQTHIQYTLTLYHGMVNEVKEEVTITAIVCLCCFQLHHNPNIRCQVNRIEFVLPNIGKATTVENDISRKRHDCICLFETEREPNDSPPMTPSTCERHWSVSHRTKTPSRRRSAETDDVTSKTSERVENGVGWRAGADIVLLSLLQPTSTRDMSTMPCFEALEAHRHQTLSHARLTRNVTLWHKQTIMVQPCCVHTLRDMATAFDDVMCTSGLECFTSYGMLLGLVRSDRLILWTLDNH